MIAECYWCVSVNQRQSMLMHIQLPSLNPFNKFILLLLFRKLVFVSATADLSCTKVICKI